MTPLYTLQHQMMDCLLHGQRDVESRISTPPRSSRAERLDIYADGYRLRLIEALQDSFPALHTLLGDERFEALANRYISATPSRHFSIRWFGDRLADFIADDGDEPHTALLAEMARFEWALRHAFDAEDIAPLPLDAMQSIPPDRWPALRFGFHPSLRRLDLEWNAPELWQAAEQEAEPLPPRRDDCPVGWIVWRQGLVTHYRSLEVDEAWALDQAMAGSAFAAICEGLCEWIDPVHAPGRIAAFLARWIGEGMVTSAER